ncbi:membrane protein [Herbaspirillum hiltneri N3]|uniref:Membrane protein n=1 Tax=Herbaspirillum hiltneri N3 TaxID=1262470 RepID=A0ABM5V1S9_9BURK|nr:YeeE/YedE family protein [Herbaspirillum hiltneri]AKZ63464.1 membrane protein [Herbaspirillum hiltneri N3]
MQNILALFIGLLFGVGLLLSGMTDPARILDFLDLAGNWNPTLLIVMGGAVLIATPAFAWARSRSRSLLGAPMQLPTRKDIDIRLVLGSLVFGAGWGLTGFCPGPALVSAAAGHAQAWIFVAAMIAGMCLHWLMSVVFPLSPGAKT